MTLRILVADDSAPLLASVGRVLREAGYEVTSTNSGADALCLLKAKPAPDLMVLDLVMPGFDGFKVLSELGPTAPPVVVITGGEAGESEFDPAKVRRVLLKPFDKDDLLKTVTDALGGQPPCTVP